MRGKRPGWRAAERTYNHLTRQIQKAAADERRSNLHAAARLALTELEQIHAHHYLGCQGGCPAHEAIDALRAAL